MVEDALKDNPPTEVSPPDLTGDKKKDTWLVILFLAIVGMMTGGMILDYYIMLIMGQITPLIFQALSFKAVNIIVIGSVVGLFYKIMDAIKKK